MSAQLIDLATRRTVQPFRRDSLSSELKERRAAKEVKGWETRRRNGWQGRAQSRSKLREDSDCFVTENRLSEEARTKRFWMAIDLVRNLPSNECEWWLDLGRKILGRPNGQDGAA